MMCDGQHIHRIVRTRMHAFTHTYIYTHTTLTNKLNDIDLGLCPADRIIHPLSLSLSLSL